MKKFLALSVSAVMAVSLLAGCGSEKTSDTAAEGAEVTETTEATETDESAETEETVEKTETTEEGRTFTVGFDAEFPPYGYMDENGEYTGFDLELAQEVCDRNGWELVKQPIDWDSKDMELSSGSIDCIWNGFTMNGREDDYTWSVPYVDNSQVFVVAADSGITSQADLAGKKVGVQKDSSALAALEGDAKVIREERLDPLCEQFMADIKANRPGVTEDQLHGKIYFAKDVVGSLIDSIGSFDDALAKVLELAEKQEESKSSQMEKYPKLESIPELKEQVYAEDGSTVLQACQLQAIEQALTTPRAEENELRSQMDSLKADHEQEVTGLQQTIAEKAGQISQKDARISELEAALSAAIAKNNQEDPASVHTHADPANSGSDEAAPAKNFAEAEAACKEFLNRMSNN